MLTTTGKSVTAKLWEISSQQPVGPSYFRVSADSTTHI